MTPRDTRPWRRHHQEFRPECRAVAVLPTHERVVCEAPPHPEGSAHMGMIVLDGQMTVVYWGGPLPAGVKADRTILPRDEDAPPVKEPPHEVRARREPPPDPEPAPETRPIRRY